MTNQPPSTIEDQIAAATATAVADVLDDRLQEIANHLTALSAGPIPEKPMTRSQLAKHLDCSLRTIDSLASAGAPHIRLGGPGGSPRFLASEVIEWMRDRSEQDQARDVA